MLPVQLGSLFEAVLSEYLRGFELVVRLIVGVLAVHGALEEADDVASAVGLLADDFSEGLKARVLYVSMWAV